MDVGDEPSPHSSTSSGDDKDSPELSTITTTAPAAETAAGRQQPPRKRRRIIISCTECHRRKQKCDRNLPCTNCVSRNKQDSCRYEAAAPTAKRAREYGGPAVTTSARGSRNVVEDDESARKQRLGPQLEDRSSSNFDLDPRLTTSRACGESQPRVKEGTLEVPTVKLADDAGGASFGYAGSGASTLGFLQRLDSEHAPGESLSSLASGTQNTAYFGTRESYKSLIRQLPARPYIEKLADIYFKDFNWQYNVSRLPR